MRRMRRWLGRVVARAVIVLLDEADFLVRDTDNLSDRQLADLFRVCIR